MRSPVHNHFTPTEADEGYTCHYCGKLLGGSLTQNSNHARSHLKKCRPDIVLPSERGKNHYDTSLVETPPISFPTSSSSFSSSISPLIWPYQEPTRALSTSCDVLPVTTPVPPETPENGQVRYLGQVLPKDAVLPTPPSPASTSQVVSVMNILRKDPPPLNLSLPTVHADPSKHIHCAFRRRRRNLPAIRAEKPSHREPSTTERQSNSHHIFIRDLIEQARHINEDLATAQEVETKNEILRRQEREQLSWWDSEKTFREFAARTATSAKDPIAKFFKWANTAEAQTQERASPPTIALGAISKHALRTFQLAHSQLYK